MESMFANISPTSDHLNQVSELWGLKSKLSFHRHLANFVYFSSIDSEEVVVRLTPPSHRTRIEIEGELAFQIFLYSKGFSVAKPIQSQRSKHVEEIKSTQNSFFASVFNKIQGERVTDEFSKTPDFLRAWGKYLGELHNLSEQHGSLNLKVQRSDWKNDSIRILSETAVQRAPEICRKRFIECTDWLESLEKKSSIFGLVHGDLHRGNFFYNDQTITSFDFDDSCYHWFLYDLAASLSSVLKAAETEIERSSIIQDFVNGYMIVREIPLSWQDRLEGFYQYRLTLVYLWMSAMIHGQRFQDATIESWKEVESWYLENMERKVTFK